MWLDLMKSQKRASMPDVPLKHRKPKRDKISRAVRRPRALPSLNNHLTDEIHEYSLADIARLFRLPPSLVVAISRAGYLTPPTREGTTGYTFQDLLILRTASALKAAKIPARQIVAALGNIRAALPPRSVLAALALSASSEDLGVRGDSEAWEGTSRQHALRIGPEHGTTATALARRPLQLGAAA
jgi:hypothetical protein